MNTWNKIFQTLSNRERLTVNILVLVIIGSLVGTVVGSYYHFTKKVPIPGGEYTEGIVGQPLYINPVLSAGNDADADLAALVFSSLFKYDAAGTLVPDLADSYDLSEDKLT